LGLWAGFFKVPPGEGLKPGGVRKKGKFGSSRKDGNRVPRKKEHLRTTLEGGGSATNANKKNRAFWYPGKGQAVRWPQTFGQLYNGSSRKGNLLEGEVDQVRSGGVGRERRRWLLKNDGKKGCGVY